MVSTQLGSVWSEQGGLYTACKINRIRSCEEIRFLLYPSDGLDLSLEFPEQNLTMKAVV